MITELPRIGRGRVSDVRRREFQSQVAEVVAWMRAYVDRLGFAPGSRSWLYAMESAGIITKGEFPMAGKWLADQRKAGLVPFDLVSEDSNRAMEGNDIHDGEATPREYINRQLRQAMEQAAMYWPASYWKHQQYFPILWTEKRDLVKLFEPELPQAMRRFASKGQPDVNSRVALIRECQWAQENDLVPLILYCGDHDPMGLQISNAIVELLRPLARVMDWELELDEMEAAGRIVRFGLNADFIENAGLLWIDGLETSSGEDLADPMHKQHSFPYVQSYLKQHGARKVEANALIANPTAARALIREELWRWLSHAGHKQWQAENDQASKEAAAHADGIKRMLAMFDSAGVLYNPRQLTAVVNKGLAELPPSPQ